CPLPPPSMPLPITSPPEICTLSLHDALPIFVGRWIPGCLALVARLARRPLRALAGLARRLVHHLTAQPFLGQLVRFLALRHLTLILVVAFERFCARDLAGVLLALEVVARLVDLALPLVG